MWKYIACTARVCGCVCASMWVRIYMCARDNNFENIEPFFLTPANIHQLVTLINISIIRFVFALYYDYYQTN